VEVVNNGIPSRWSPVRAGQIHHDCLADSQRTRWHERSLDMALGRSAPNLA